jgi:chorismate synthase
MSINAVKGVEIGDGFAVASQFGHESRDELTPQGFTANHSGGVMGGISSGQQIVVSIALKPTSSITTAGRRING